MMNFFSFYRVELGRVLKSKVTWLAAFMSLLAAAAPLLLQVSYDISTRFTDYIGLCNLWGSLGGGIFFAMLSFYELSKLHRSQADRIIEAVVSPQRLYIARSMALLSAGVISGILTMLALLPYGLITMPNIFESVFYIQSFLLFTTCSILLSILLAASLYAIFRKVSAAVIVFLAIAYACCFSSQFMLEPLVKWLMPSIGFLSDEFGNDAIIKLNTYIRLIWFLLFGGLFLLALSCLRKYERGLFGSLQANVKGKRALSALLAVVMLLSGGAAYALQPLYDHSPPLSYDVAYSEEDGEADEGDGMVTSGDGFSIYIPEEEAITDLLLMRSSFEIDIDADRGSLSGTVEHTIVNRSQTESSASLFINTGYRVEHIYIDGNEVSFEDLQNDTDGKKEIVFLVPAAEGEQLVEVHYGGRYQMWNLLKGAMEGSDGIYERYISLGGGDLYPYFDCNEDDQVRSIGSITMPERFVLASTGASNAVISESDGKRTWSVDSASSAITLEAAEYIRKTIYAGGLEIEFFYNKKHEEIMEEIGVVPLLEDVVNYFTDLLGPLPYDSNVPFKIIQCTALGGGGYAKYNISVMSETTFSVVNLNDLNRGASSEEVLVHEIIHQWWGISMMCYDMENSWWTNEGITVFCTYLYVRDRFGEEYANTYYLKHWESETANMFENFYFRNPDYQSVLSEQYLSTLEGTYQSTQQYSLAPLAIYEAAQKVGYERVMSAMAELYQNGGSYLPPYISFQDFLDAIGLKKEDISIVSGL